MAVIDWQDGSDGDGVRSAWVFLLGEVPGAGDDAEADVRHAGDLETAHVSTDAAGLSEAAGQSRGVG